VFASLLFPVLAEMVQAQAHAFVSVRRINRRIAGRVVDHTHNHGGDRRLFSPVLGKPRDLYVYLPPGYSRRRAYPLILYFHGAFEDEHGFLEGDRVTFLDRAILEGRMPPVIVACPDGIPSGRNRVAAPHSLYLNGLESFEDHIMLEVLPFLLRTYSILPGRRSHAILGLSAGGAGALVLAIRHRDVFGAVAVLSAPVNLRYDTIRGDYREDFHPASYRWKTRYDPDEVVGTFGHGLIRLRAGRFVEPVFGTGPGVVGRIAGQNPVEVLLRADLRPGELPIYIHYAGRDQLNLDAQALSFRWLTAGRGLDLTVEADPTAGHSNSYFRENQKRAYRWLARHLPPPGDIMPGPPPTRAVAH
jgi:S-formylglutathione hydrolase FrmB